MESEKLKEVYGEIQEFITPSRNRVVIREQNGEDDDILSNALDVRKGIASAKFLSGVILEYGDTKRRLSYKEVLDMKVSDFYYIMIVSRIFSLGQILNFTYHWDGVPAHTEYQEDLSRYIWDYSKDFPFDPSESGYDEFRIKPTTPDLSREITLTSGKMLSYKYMTPNGENFINNTPPEKSSKNTELFARELKQKTNTGWTLVENFKFFSPTDMKEIRKDIMDNDPLIELLTEIPSPLNPNQKIFYPILSSPDFFFPREI